MSNQITHTKDNNAQGGSDRAFGIVFTTVFAVIGLYPLATDGELKLWALASSLVILIITFSRPSILGPFNRIWTKFGLILHKIISPIVLGIIFFLAVVPTGLFMRLMGKDILKLKQDSNVSSYWEKRESPGPSPESMKRQY